MRLLSPIALLGVLVVAGCAYDRCCDSTPGCCSSGSVHYHHSMPGPGPGVVPDGGVPVPDGMSDDAPDDLPMGEPMMDGGEEAPADLPEPTATEGTSAPSVPVIIP